MEIKFRKSIEYTDSFKTENLLAAVKLMQRYRNITSGEIEEARKKLDEKKEFHTYAAVAGELTGYGDTHTCTLCITAGTCGYCFWEVGTGNSCNTGSNLNTYARIYNADNEDEFLEALRDRADYIEECLLGLFTIKTLNELKKDVENGRD